MIRTAQFKAIIIFLFIPLFVTALNTSKLKGKYSKEKKINREYSVSPKANLSIKNSYGNLNIVTWNENRIVIEVTITTSGNNEEKVNKRLNDISIEFENDSNHVSATTKFNKGSWKNKNNINVKVNYIVKMPVSNSVDLDNDYGIINLGKLEGQAILNCDYGKIMTKELLADNNILVFNYSNGCYFDYIKSGQINADFSSFTVEKTERLDINTDYTKSEIEIAKDINYNCDFGSIFLKKVNTVNGNGDYLNARFGEIYNTAILKADYGFIKIKALQEGSNMLSIQAGYSDIKIGFEPNLSFNFKLNLSYANLNGNHDGFIFKKKVKASIEKKYDGYYGNENSGREIIISSQYGNVNFIKRTQ
jgi:hypothetical protein